MPRRREDRAEDRAEDRTENRADAGLVASGPVDTDVKASGKTSRTGAPAKKETGGNDAGDTADDDIGAGATIEDMLDEVDRIVAQLDSGEIPLEESFKIYERGMKLVSCINTRIDKVEKKIIEIEAESGGEVPSEGADDEVRGYGMDI